MAVTNITVVGAGVMGRGIAYVSALAGFQTTLVDISESQLQEAIEQTKQTAQKGLNRSKLTHAEFDQILENLHPTTNLQKAVKSTDFLIEAVPEKRVLKQSVMEEAEKYAAAHVIFTSNTSTISPTELASYTNRPQKFAVMHFFNPVHIMKLVEIVRGLETTNETVKIVREIAEKMGKETVEVNE